MRIIAHLHNQYNGKVSKEIVYWGTIDQAKQDLYYIEYDGDFYEWFMYKDGFAGYDYEAEYSRMKGKPPFGYKVHLIPNDNPWGAPKCECGSDKLGHPGHSTWCQKFRRF